MDVKQCANISIVHSQTPQGTIMWTATHASELHAHKKCLKEKREQHGIVMRTSSCLEQCVDIVQRALQSETLVTPAPGEEDITGPEPGLTREQMSCLQQADTIIESFFNRNIEHNICNINKVEIQGYGTQGMPRGIIDSLREWQHKLIVLLEITWTIEENMIKNIAESLGKIVLCFAVGFSDGNTNFGARATHFNDLLLEARTEALKKLRKSKETAFTRLSSSALVDTYSTLVKQTKIVDWGIVWHVVGGWTIPTIATEDDPESFIKSHTIQAELGKSFLMFSIQKYCIIEDKKKAMEKERASSLEAQMHLLKQNKETTTQQIQPEQENTTQSIQPEQENTTQSTQPSSGDESSVTSPQAQYPGMKDKNRMRRKKKFERWGKSP